MRLVVLLLLSACIQPRAPLDLEERRQFLRELDLRVDALQRATDRLDAKIKALLDTLHEDDQPCVTEPQVESAVEADPAKPTPGIVDWGYGYFSMGVP